MPAQVSPVNLRRDDSDTAGIYDGRKAASATHVADLHELLEEFGIRLFEGLSAPQHDPNVFGLLTEWAVREFQIYAAMPNLRKGSGATATHPSNPAPYTGPVSGYVDEATRAAMTVWKTNDFRVPVVVSSFAKSSYASTKPELDALPLTATPISGGANLWRHNQYPHEKANRMFARDLSGLYTRPGSDLKQYHVLGGYTNAGSKGVGSRAIYHSWEEAAVHHSDFGPVPSADLAKTAFYSTFRTVAGVSRVECEGFYDVLNAYDRAMLSFGLVHWTLFDRISQTSPDLGTAELPAALAYMEQAAGSAPFRDALKRFGIGFAAPWTHRSGSASGLSLRNSQLGNYKGLTAVQAADGRFDERTWTKDEATQFKAWHWFYRFAMAGRLRPQLRKPMWDLARMRIRDLLGASWPTGGTFPTVGGRPATIGETMTSERAIALLLRWHVLRPGALIGPASGSDPSHRDLRAIWSSATSDGGGPFPASVASWGDDEEFRLIRAIINHANALGDEIENSINLLSQWLSVNDLRQPVSPPLHHKIREIEGDDPAVELHPFVIDPNPPVESHVANPSGTGLVAHPVLLQSLNRGLVLSLPANDRVRRFMDSVLTTPLDTDVGLITEKPNKQWFIYEVHLQLPVPVPGMNVLRKFEITLPDPTGPFLIREVPSVSIKRDSFKFFPDGLPALPSDEPLGNISVTAADLAAGPVTANLTTQLRNLLANFPTMSFDPGGGRVEVEETDRRWIVFLGAAADVNKPYLTLRHVSTSGGTITLSVDPPGCSQRYGGRDLKPGDTGASVTALRTDLRALGFFGVAATGTTFDPNLLTGVREFQAYAKLPNLARAVDPPPPNNTPYADTLEPATNEQPYQGPVAGVVNDETRALIDYWISQRNRLRCPVVVQSCSDATGAAIVNQNLWGATEDPTTSHRMFVVDFTSGAKQRSPLGAFVEHPAGNIRGPRIRNEPNFRPSPALAEATPRTLLDTTTPDDDQKKVFRVLRAVYEEAFGGYVDGVDAAAPGATGLGAFRLNDHPGTASIVGSLGALLSHAREYQLADYRTGIEDAGVAPDKLWHPLGRRPDGAALRKGNKLRRHECGLQHANYTFPLGTLKRFGSSVGPIREDQFRSWHWTYRLARAARHAQPNRPPGLGLSGSELLRVNLADLGAAAWPNDDLNGTGTMRPSLDSVFTSELAWALLLRWHLLHPEDIIDKEKVHPDLALAVKNAGLSAAPSTWGDAEESKLLTVLQDYLVAKHAGTNDPARLALPELSQWPNWTAANATDNPRGFALNLTDFVDTATIPLAGHASDLNAGTLPVEVATACATLTGDTFWTSPTATPTVTVKRTDALWIASVGLRTVSLVADGANLLLRLGLRPQRKSFTTSPAKLGPLPPPAYATTATGTATQTALLELCPPTPTTGAKQKFGIALLTREFQNAGSSPLNFDQVIFSVAGASSADPIEGLAIPLQTPLNFGFKLAETPHAAKVTEPGSEEVELPILSVAPDSPLPDDMDLALDFGGALAAEDVIDIPGAALQLAGLTFDPGLGHVVGRRIRAELSIRIPFLQGPFDLSFASSGDKPPSTAPDPADYDRLAWDGSTSVATFDPLTLASKLPGGFPFVLPSSLPFGLEAGLTGGKLDASFAADLGAAGAQPVIDLGSPLAQLKLVSPLDLTLSLQDGLRVAVKSGEDLNAELAMDLFAEVLGATPKVINHLWESIPSGGADFGKLLKLTMPSGVAAPEGPLVTWRDRRPTVDVSLFQGFDTPTVNPQRRMRTFAGDLLGTAVPCVAKFKDAASKFVRFRLSDDQATFRLEVPMQLVLGSQDVTSTDPTVFEAEGTFGFEVGAAADAGAVRLTATALKADPVVTLRVNSDEFAKGCRLGDLLSVHVPRGTAFSFNTDPRKASVRWDRARSEEQTEGKIVVRLPATAPGHISQPEELAEPEDLRFSFVVQKLSVNNRGFDLGALVRAENVKFGEELDSGFDKGAGLAVQNAESKGGNGEPVVGELCFENSRLTYGSLQAGCKLRYFDDANGTFKVVMAQDPGTKALSVAGSFDITGNVEYRVDALYALFQLKHLHIGTKWSGSKWESEGHMTGAVQFKPPPGGSAGSLGPLSELFSGVTCEFERLNPVKLGAETTVRFLFPPKQFEFAKVFVVDLHGIEVGAVENVKSFGLLGDITIKELPGVDSSLTFGGITLSQSGGSFPSFSINRIGAKLSTAGGFTIEGELEYIKNEQEIGFGGAVSIVTDALPPLSGLVKLTLAKTTEDRKTVPTVAVYFEADYELPLFAEFYLRSLGIGIGINQALRGLKPEPNAGPLPQRISKFVDDPEGLPNPRTLSAWIPDPPKKRSDLPHWMLVANGLITLTKAPMDRPHTLLGSVLVALDHQLQLTVGVNVWLFASPNEVRSREFQRNPVARGAIAFSPREKTLSAYFRTLPEPKLGKDAPELVSKVLKNVRTSLRFQADRNGVLYEVGWPWETEIDIPSPPLQAPLRGRLTSGYRYGLYRGVLVYGLNFAITVGFDAGVGVNFSTPLGSAGASLKVTGSGYLRCSFNGALDTSRLQPYLLGDVRVGATVNVKAEAHVSLSKKISRWFKIRLRIDFSASFNISITAALTAALDSDGIGFDGSAHVSVSVKGYRLAGRVAFKHREEKIESVRRQLERVLPPPIGDRSVHFAPEAAFALAATPLPKVWTYRQRRLANRDLLAVCLLPTPGREYPGIRVDPNLPNPPIGDRYKLKLKPEGHKCLQGFLGDLTPPAQSGVYRVWTERIEHVLLTAAQIMEEFEQDDDSAAQDRPQDMTVLHFLAALYESQPSGLSAKTVPGEDVQDSRIQNPTSADVDDATVGAAREGQVSPYLQRDNHYDSQVSAACRRDVPPPSSGGDPEAPSEGLSTGLIAAELLDFFRNDTAGSEANYTIAPHLRAILVFDLSRLGADDRIREADDPVSELIVFDDPDTTLAGDVGVTIESVTAPANNREYDLLPGHVFQSESEIALAWDFAFEKSLPGDDLLTVYESGFEQFRVTRVNLNRTRSKPRVVDVAPCWLDPGDGSYVRPQFQFVDQDVNEDVDEGDLLQYRVDAIGQDGPDNPLTSCLFNVVRNTVKPLAPPAQAVAFHVPAAKKRQGGGADVFDDAGTIEIGVVAPSDEPGFAKTDLRIQARLVPAGQFGAYGFDSPPDVQLDPRLALPEAAARSLAGKDENGNDKYVPEIRFAELRRGRPLPWEETEELKLLAGSTWTEIKIVDEEQPRVIGMRTEVTVAQFLAAVEAEFGALQQGVAIEVSVGRVKNGAPKSPMERSALATCRHAVLMTERETLPGFSPSDYFLQGNEVAAIELLPAFQPQRADDENFLDTGMFVAEVVDTSVEEVPPQAALTWRMPAPGQTFDPTTGFRIHRVDRLDPYRYRTRQQGASPVFEREVEVLPQSVFRSTPNSIDLVGIQSKGPDGAGSEFTADWKPLVDAVRLWEPAAEPTTAPGFTYQYAFQRLTTSGTTSTPSEFRERWLHTDVRATLQRLIELLAQPALGEYRNVGVNYTLVGQFEDKADALVDTDAQNAARRATRFLDGFRTLTEQHTDLDDVYGWQAAGMLGLACEVVLFDDQGTPLPIDELVRQHGLLTELAEKWGSELLPEISLAFFLGDDGESYLNTIRLQYTGSWPEWSTTQGPRPFDLGIALKTSVLGRNPDDVGLPVFDADIADAVRGETDPWAQRAANRIRRGAVVLRVDRFNDPEAVDTLDGRTLNGITLPPALPSVLRERLSLHAEQGIVVTPIIPKKKWKVTRTNSRADLQLELADGTLRAYLSNTAGGLAVTYRRAPASSASLGRRLPVDRDGLVRARLPIPDRLAHQYDFALELERRYDRLWRRLLDSTAPTSLVPFTHIRSLAVDRTAPLVPHNVLATPLAGSVQGYVFTHPAEFASTSSALNAAHIQYSGQTVALQRRIVKYDRVERVFADGFGGVDWGKYKEWVEDKGNLEQKGTAPNLHFHSGPAPSLALEPVEKTRSGIYGADRYVYPDLPGYYEYRLIVWSSAGRARSPAEASTFVSPLHDQALFDEQGNLVKPARQQPRTVPIQATAYTAGTTTVELGVRLIHPRLHMRDDVAGLWIASDEHLTLGGADIRYGSLPDLFLGYHIFLRLNPGKPDETPVLTPLLQIIPPLDPSQNTETKFLAKLQDPDVHLAHGGGSVQQALLDVQQQNDGELRFEITVAFADSATLSDLLARAHNQGIVPQLFQISVVRGGAFSEIVETP